VGLFQSYGAALMIGSPTIAGFSTGAIYARLRPDARVRDAFVAATISGTLSMAVIVIFAIEGLACFAMAFPLFLLPAYLGALIGFEAGKKLPPRAADAGVGVALLVLPFLVVLERASPLPALTPPPVETAITIDAPPERVWTQVAQVSEMPPPESAAFSWGIAYPIRATLDAPRAGAVRRCEFSTGTALETVTTWDPPRRLVFRIDAQPDPMVERTLWRGPRQPHLDGYVRNALGEFELTPIDAGARTRLVARSWYTVRITPETYWRAWSDPVVHAIHRRVMGWAKTRAEAPFAPVAAR
jgi:uncharacterized protein YndB with AHSA1/START domain